MESAVVTAPNAGSGALMDGVYLVERPNFVAGFQVRNGRVEGCAPILRRKIDYWKTVAQWVAPLPPNDRSEL